MKLRVDMNLSPRWVGVMADAGIEAKHWSTLGAYNAPDTEIMAYANTNNYVVLTHDLDFSAILAATHGEKPSVVQILAPRMSAPIRSPSRLSLRFGRWHPSWKTVRCSLSIQTARACACCH